MYAAIADLLTLSRLVGAAILIWLGTQGPGSLNAAILTAALSWTTDQLDGWFARRATTPTRLAPADFAIDTVLYAGTLTYLVLAGFVPLLLAAALAVLTLALALVYRRKAVVILGVRFVDLASAIVIFKHRPAFGAALLAWVAVLGVIYRRRALERIPRWLTELKTLVKP